MIIKEFGTISKTKDGKIQLSNFHFEAQGEIVTEKMLLDAVIEDMINTFKEFTAKNTLSVFQDGLDWDKVRSVALGKPIITPLR